MSENSERLARLFNRRAALGGAGLGAAAITLAGCGSNSEQSSSGGSSSSDIDPRAPQEPTDVAAASDVPVGGVYKATAGNTTVMVTQPEKGNFKAFSAVCTHQGCIVNVQDSIMVCPCHGAKYSPKDGSVTAGPAPKALPEFKVQKQGERLIVS